MGQVPPLRALNEKQEEEARQMSCRYRQPLKCKYPGPAMLCLQMSALGCRGKGGGGGSLVYAMVTEEAERCPTQGQPKQGKGRSQPSLTFTSALHSLR